MTGNGMHPQIVAFYGSPRKKGNTTELLKKAVAGAQTKGAKVEEIYLSDLDMSPCLEIYGCKQAGRCVIQDDFQTVYDKIDTCDGIMLASPIFFYGVSAHTKILMDRCQSFWVRQNWLQTGVAEKPGKKIGLFISVGATNGKKLFDGALLSVRYFLKALDGQLWDSLLYRGLDFEGDVERHPDYLEAAYAMGARFAEAVIQGKNG